MVTAPAHAATFRMPTAVLYLFSSCKDAFVQLQSAATTCEARNPSAALELAMEIACVAAPIAALFVCTMEAVSVCLTPSTPVSNKWRLRNFESQEGALDLRNQCKRLAFRFYTHEEKVHLQEYH